MFRFVYNHINYRAFLTDLAAALHVNIRNERLIFPSGVADGYFELLELPNGLQAMLIDYTGNQEIYLQRTRSQEEFYTLRLDEMDISESFLVRIDNDYVKQPAHNRSAVFLTSSLFDLSYLGSPGTHVKAINILMSREWVARYLGLNTVDDLLRKYLALKTASLNFEPMDAEYRQLISDIQETDRNDPLWLAKAETRIMQMIERFFSRLYKKAGQLAELQLSNEEIYKVMQIEHLLVSDYKTPPPSISNLSKMAAVSPSKLKKQFKEIYGMPIFEYYQHNRMLKAKELLLRGEYSVKEVGYEIGYANLSNFAVAFRKEFTILPSELVKGK